MDTQTLVTVGFTLMVVAVVVGAIFLIYCAIQIRRLAMTVTDLCRHTDERLTPVLEETEKTLKSLRVITNDVGAITGNIREVSDAACDVAVNIRAIAMLIGDFREQVTLQAHGIKAGVQAALGMLLKNSSDRR
jgi:hypothetical protein